MSIIHLPIDIKSLYFNIKNDNEKGHTATVATPLKQGASVHEKLSKIHYVPHNINDYSRDSLIGHILSKSRVEAIITDVFVFDSITVNGLAVECGSSFCIYIREETSVYKGYKQDKIEMRGDRAEMSDFPLYLNTVAGGLDRRDQTIGGFSFVVKIYAVPVV